MSISNITSEELMMTKDLDARMKVYEREQNLIAHFLSNRRSMAISAAYINRLLNRGAAPQRPAQASKCNKDKKKAEPRSQSKPAKTEVIVENRHKHLPDQHIKQTPKHPAVTNSKRQKDPPLETQKPPCGFADINPKPVQADLKSKVFEPKSAHQINPTFDAYAKEQYLAKAPNKPLCLETKMKSSLSQREHNCDLHPKRKVSVVIEENSKQIIEIPSCQPNNLDPKEQNKAKYQMTNEHQKQACGSSQISDHRKMINVPNIFGNDKHKIEQPELHNITGENPNPYNLNSPDRKSPPSTSSKKCDEDIHSMKHQCQKHLFDTNMQTNTHHQHKPQQYDLMVPTQMPLNMGVQRSYMNETQARAELMNLLNQLQQIKEEQQKQQQLRDPSLLPCRKEEIKIDIKQYSIPYPEQNTIEIMAPRNFQNTQPKALPNIQNTQPKALPNIQNTQPKALSNIQKAEAHRLSQVKARGHSSPKGASTSVSPSKHSANSHRPGSNNSIRLKYSGQPKNKLQHNIKSPPKSNKTPNRFEPKPPSRYDPWSEPKCISPKDVKPLLLDAMTDPVNEPIIEPIIEPIVKSAIDFSRYHLESDLQNELAKLLISDNQSEDLKSLCSKNKYEEFNTFLPKTINEDCKSFSLNSKNEDCRSLSPKCKHEEVSSLSPIEDLKSLSPKSKNEDSRSLSLKSKTEDCRSLSPKSKNEEIQSLSPMSKNTDDKTMSPKCKNEDFLLLSPKSKSEDSKSLSPNNKNEDFILLSPKSKNEDSKLLSPKSKNEDSKSSSPKSKNEDFIMLTPKTKNEDSRSLSLKSKNEELLCLSPRNDISPPKIKNGDSKSISPRNKNEDFNISSPINKTEDTKSLSVQSKSVDVKLISPILKSNTASPKTKENVKPILYSTFTNMNSKSTADKFTSVMKKKVCTIKQKDMEEYFRKISEDNKELMKKLERVELEQALERQRWLDEFSIEMAQKLTTFIMNDEGRQALVSTKNVEDISELILVLVAEILHEERPSRNAPVSALSPMQRFMLTVSDRMADWLEAVLVGSV